MVSARACGRHASSLQGKTAVGRATIAVLSINDPDAVAAREALMEEGVFPAGG
jgi:hypothetical protein